MEEAGSGLGLSMSVSNSYLIGQASLTTPTVSFRHPHPSTTLSLMWVLCGPGLAQGLDLCVLHMWYSLFISPLPVYAFTCGRPSRVTNVVAVWSNILSIHPSMCALCVFLLCVVVWPALVTLSSQCFWVCAVDGVLCSVGRRNGPRRDGSLFDLFPLCIEWGVCVWSSTSQHQQHCQAFSCRNI